MIRPVPPTLLQDHTLDTLLDELVSGRPVALTSDGQTFHLSSRAARSVFAWYREHPAKWSKSVSKDDVEAIVDQLDIAPPVLRSLTSPGEMHGKRLLFLKSLRAYRFGGIHRFGTPREAPADFVFTFEKALTLIEGANGAGKTSLLSAILWCLTGFVYCPLRPPEPANQSVQVAPGAGAERSAAAISSRVMSPITPLPPADVLKGLGDSPLPLDTWVELTFVDERGNEVGTVRRKMQRGPQNSVVVKETGLSALGLDAMACEVGTRMPGLLPYIELGATSDLGKAVAALIGIKPLQDLAQHAQRVQNKLRKDFPKERAVEIRGLDDEYAGTHQELTDLLGRHPALSRECNLPRADTQDCAAELASWQAHFERLQAETLATAREILGDSFDNNDPSARADLLKSVGPALGQLDPAHLGGLPSARRLAALGKLPEEDLVAAETLIGTLQQEARDLDALAQQPAWAARLRLYARVVGWMKDHPEQGHAVETCPVCRRALEEGQVDELSGKPIADHLRELFGSDTQFLQKTAAAWAQDAIARLQACVCATLQGELKQELPVTPAALMVAALSEELFASQCFRGCLSVLKPAARSLCDKAAARMPAFNEPAVAAFPAGCGGSGHMLTAVRRLGRAVAFARWRRGHDKVCREAFASIVGEPDDCGQEELTPAGPGDEQPLYERLTSLDRLVKTAEPISLALTQIRTLVDTLAKRQGKLEHILRYGRAAEAIQELLGLPALVEKQVTILMKTLADATAQWKDRLYSPAFLGAPCAVGPEVGPDGTISVDAAADGAQAAAQHISNTSELRATLFAFFLAFWEHRLETHGGLALLLLDDPQELFDRPNRRRIAKAIPAVAKKGANLIMTTLDSEFGRQVVAAAGPELGYGALDHLRIHCPKAIRPHIAVGPFAEDVEEKWRAFQDPQNENEAEPARDYLKALRIYVENRLVDFFDVPEPGLPRLFSLSDLIGAVRSRVNAGMGAFADPAFRALVSAPALTPGSDFLALLNESHHGNQNQIQFSDVANVKDQCLHVVRLVAAAHEAYERWLRRDPRDAAPAMPESPAVIPFPGHEVPLFENLAAFTTESPPGAAVESEERFSTAFLSHHCLFVISTNNFGFAGPMNCRAIVDLSDKPVADNGLVIALHKANVYARRLHRDQTSPGFVMLTSDAVDPTRRPPSVLLPAEEVRLLKVVGILFDDRPHFPRPTEEAVPDRHMNCLAKLEIAFKVRGPSAEPLALPGQTVIGGRRVTPEELPSIEGAVVAVAMSDAQESVFKRVGKAVPGAPHVRHLEAIGGRGESTLIRTEEIADDPFHEVPLLAAARQVLGVLYE
jgi:hypothetical protein